VLKDDAVAIDTGSEYYHAPPVQTDGIYREADPNRNNGEDLLRTARAESERIIEQARGEAQSIAFAAEREMENLKNAALEDARSRGYDEGFNKGVSDWDSIKREAEQILFDTYAEREEIIKGMEPKMVGLIIKILEKLLGEYARINPQIILKLIREGLSVVVGSEGVKLRVSTQAYDLARENMDKITEYAGSNNVELIKDASLKSMDCVIETQYGNIDSSLGQQFETLKADLLHTLSGAEA